MARLESGFHEESKSSWGNRFSWGKWPLLRRVHVLEIIVWPMAGGRQEYVRPTLQHFGPHREGSSAESQALRFEPIGSVTHVPPVVQTTNDGTDVTASPHQSLQLPQSLLKFLGRLPCSGRTHSPE